MTTRTQLAELDPGLEQLLAHLDQTRVLLDDFGCIAALSQDKSTIFECPMLADGSPDLYEGDSRHLCWAEVTAPEPAFVAKINEVFGTKFEWHNFAGN